jgi:hypothetical protein
LRTGILRIAPSNDRAPRAGRMALRAAGSCRTGRSQAPLETRFRIRGNSTLLKP